MHTLYINITKEQLPIIYRKEYNVRFGGLERLHPFDTKKWENIFNVGYLNSFTLVFYDLCIVDFIRKRNDIQKDCCSAKRSKEGTLTDGS